MSEVVGRPRSGTRTAFAWEMPVQITFRNIQPSPAIEEKIRFRIEKLQRFHNRITNCHVVVEAPHHHKRKGHLYNIRIDLTVPGSEIVVNREPSEREEHSDPHVAVRDAFDALTRRLEDHSRRKRGDVKTHVQPDHGRVVRIFPLDGYGFLESPDGLEVYFHENAVLGATLANLAPGTAVRFSLADTESPKGPQASSVELIGKHHLIP